MECPNRGCDLDGGATECPRCGVIIAKPLRRLDLERVELAVPSRELEADIGRARTEAREARRELAVRALALPVALLGAHVAVRVAPAGVRMMAMWVHETGHATAAWLCGYMAFPGPWFTPIGSQRSPILSLLIVSLLVWGGTLAWQRRRWFWVAASGVALALVGYCTLRLHSHQAEQLFTFGGDGGNFALGTLLMLTLYSRDDHPLRREGLRWALVAIGALAFSDAAATWSGNVDTIPFGEDDRGLSDSSQLVEVYRWSVDDLMAQYALLKRACLTVLGLTYLAQLAVSAYEALPEPDPTETQPRNVADWRSAARPAPEVASFAPRHGHRGHARN